MALSLDKAYRYEIGEQISEVGNDDPHAASADRTQEVQNSIFIVEPKEASHGNARPAFFALRRCKYNGQLQQTD